MKIATPDMIEKGASPVGASNKIIEVRNISKIYGTEVVALKDINLDFRAGQLTSLLGPSGCGKTTLLKIIAGLLPATQGEVLVNGKKISGPGPERAFVFQDFALLPWASVLDNAAFGLKMQGMGKSEREEIANHYVREVGLDGFQKSYPHQLSGGMRQRVVIALATVCRPNFIIADEPTTALDVVVQKDVLAMIRNVQREMGSSVVFVTHDMGVHANIADRIGIIYAGRLVEEGPARTLFTAPKHPYTAHLVGSLPRIGDSTPKASLEGRPPNLADPPPGCRFHPRCPMAVDKCRVEIPPLETVGADHRSACWRSDEVGPPDTLANRKSEGVA